MVVSAVLVPGVVRSAQLDGSTPMICAVMAVTECNRWGSCEPVDAATAGIPTFMRVDVAQKSLEATDGSGRKSPIESATVVQDKERLVLQGSGQGRAWSAVIGQQLGELTATIVDHDGGFVLSGACTLP
jgi:hypothetical protein